jgi:glycosyltransferase involved in cell wall biosynthesis
MNISVVVCAKNEEKFIGDCLRNLTEQTLRPEIIVVDGHSKDRTVSIANRYADKVVEDNRKGIADARNIGWKVAKGDIVAYCDADCLPHKDWVKNILKHMNGNVCVFGPLIPYEGKTKVKIELKVWGDLFLKASSLFGYPCICAANVAFKKSVLKKHPFRYQILEDFDVGNRIRKVGKVKFYRDLYMPLSTRRFKEGFHRLAFKYYLLNYFRLKTGKKMKSYF